MTYPIAHPIFSSSLLSALSAGALRHGAAALAAAALAACGGGDGGAPPGSTGTSPGATQNSTPAALDAGKTCNIANFAPEFLERVNAVRGTGATCGGKAAPAVAKLSWNNLLFEAAAAHSKDMVDNQFFDHVNPNNPNFTLGPRIAAQGYDFSAAGENIAAGQRDVQEVMNAWMSSPGHCSNIMNGEMQDVALACVTHANNTRYWTMVAARPQ